MPAYRVYFIECDGRVQVGDPIQAIDDEAAIAAFDGLARPGLTSELWQGGRLVRRLPHDKG
ncbi:MAG: hypothetical protein ABW042_11850 [Phenylobacterium sp.]